MIESAEDDDERSPLLSRDRSSSFSARRPYARTSQTGSSDNADYDDRSSLSGRTILSARPISGHDASVATTSDGLSSTVSQSVEHNSSTRPSLQKVRRVREGIKEKWNSDRRIGNWNQWKKGIGERDKGIKKWKRGREESGGRGREVRGKRRGVKGLRNEERDGGEERDRRRKEREINPCLKAML